MFGLISVLLVTGIAIMVFMPLISKSRSRQRGISVIIGVIAPIASAVIYLTMSSPSTVVADTAPTPPKILEPIVAPSLGSVEEMADRLHKRLLENPNDPKGWRLLASSYDHMGNAGAADAARKRAESVASTGDQPQPNNGNVSLHGTITLTPELTASVNDSDTVYVYARAAEGPRMPIAARRYTAKDLPIQFILNDDYVLSTSRSLANAPRLLIGAKLSRSGNAITSGQQLTGLSEAVSPYSSDAIDIVIQAQPVND